MWAALQAHATRGLPIYAECGGLMYLCEWLEDHDGQRYPQVGLIPGGTRMTTRLQQFGYAEATFVQDTLVRSRQQFAVRGHRFHYSVYEPMLAMPLPCAYRITRATTGETHYEGFGETMCWPHTSMCIWAVNHTWRSTLSISAGVGARHETLPHPHIGLK